MRRSRRADCRRATADLEGRRRRARRRRRWTAAFAGLWALPLVSQASPAEPGSTPLSNAPLVVGGDFVDRTANGASLGTLQPRRPVDPSVISATPGSYSELTRAAPPSFVAPTPAAPASDVVNLDELIPIDRTPIQTASLTTTDTVPYANEVAPKTRPSLPPGTRAGIFQKVMFKASWLPRLSEDADTLGVTSLDAGVVLGFPFFERETPLLITPRFGAHLLENSVALDLPSTLYDASVEFRHLRKFGNGPWAMDVAATVGYYSDFEIDSGDAVRVTGRGLAVYESSPATKWVGGVAYLNRAGATVLPVAGVIHQPSPDISWEFIFPRPRITWKTPESCEGDQRWWYVGGEFGGGIWAVERRSTSALDVVSYNDLRVLIGYERKIVGGLSQRYEFGYVFDRNIEYESATPDATLDDTLFARVGLTY